MTRQDISSSQHLSKRNALRISTTRNDRGKFSQINLFTNWHNVAVFFSFIILCQFSQAQIISQIEINGAKNFSQNDYIRWSEINIDSKLFTGIEDSIKEKISEALSSEGYYHYKLGQISISNIDSIKAILSINLDEGSPTLIRNISIKEKIPDSIYVQKSIQNLSGNIFSSSSLEKVFDQILTNYENIGYPFALIKVESVSFADDSSSGKHFADILLSIDAGKRAQIDKIEIEGNSKTKPDVIIRATRINTGDFYSQKVIDEIPNRLNRLRFFDPVEQPTFFLTNRNEGVLKILIKEINTNNFDGIAGYVPSTNTDESGYFTGYININLRNMFGTGRSALIKWQQENRNSQELELRYLEPWLLGLPFNIEFGLFQRKQDSTYVQRNIEGRVEYLATEDISASLILNSQSTIPSEAGQNNFTVYNSTSITSGFNLKIDTRDDYYSPKQGVLFNSTYKFSRKSINGPEKFITPETQTEYNQQRIEFDLSYFRELFTDQIAAASIHVRELRGTNLELSDLYFLGGVYSLRGYKEKQFQGNRTFWSNLEYRYLLSRRSFAFLFFDTGYFLRDGNANKNIPRISEFKIGYGFGLNIETGLGVLSVSFALGKGDSFTDGKIHFGILNEF